MPLIIKEVKHLGMIAGGSGIVPLYQIARTICLDEKDQTQIKLVSSNHVRIYLIYFNHVFEI
jgi:cytochrome-b5 reductase